MIGEIVKSAYRDALAEGCSVALLAALATTLLVTGAFIAVESYRIGRADGHDELARKPESRCDLD